jgi:hypothetical protein
MSSAASKSDIRPKSKASDIRNSVVNTLALGTFGLAGSHQPHIIIVFNEYFCFKTLFVQDFLSIAHSY